MKKVTNPSPLSSRGNFKICARWENGCSVFFAANLFETNYCLGTTCSTENFTETNYYDGIRQEDNDIECLNLVQRKVISYLKAALGEIWSMKEKLLVDSENVVGYCRNFVF